MHHKFIRVEFGGQESNIYLAVSYAILGRLNHMASFRDTYRWGKKPEVHSWENLESVILATETLKSA